MKKQTTVKIIVMLTALGLAIAHKPYIAIALLQCYAALVSVD